MKIDCLHGYFKFTETAAGQVSYFANLFELDLVPKDDYFTFSALEDAPDYSILGDELLTLVATKTFEGPPSEVMRENKLVYNFALDLVQPILSVTNLIEVTQTENYFLSTGLIIPGSLKVDGARVTDYSAWFFRDRMQFRYSGFKYYV